MMIIKSPETCKTPMSKPSKDDESGVMHSLKGVRKLEFDRVDLNQQKPRGKIRIAKTPADIAGSNMTANVSRHLSTSIPDHWFQHGMQKKLQRKIRTGMLEIQATLDLHGYRQLQATAELELFLQQALHSQLRFVLIIHGKGFRSASQARLRPLVQHWLQQQAGVLAFCPAQPRDGGSGASYVYLKSQ